MFWFALLQVIAPFIHAHLGAEYLTETASLHVHTGKHEHSDSHNDNNHHVADLSHTMQTVTVTDGFINYLENGFTFYAALYVVCFMLVKANQLCVFILTAISFKIIPFSGDVPRHVQHHNSSLK